MLKATAFLLSLGLILSSAFAQTPPPNDNFADRIVLSGTNLTFTGTLTNATFETSEPSTYYYRFSQSVWWQWTAPSTTLLNVRFADPLPYNPGYSSTIGAAIDIFPMSSGVSSLSGLSSNFIEAIYFAINSADFPSGLCIPVTAGSNYLIRLSGTNVNTVRLSLVADNNPLILKQPVSRTVSSNECALFYVLASSTAPLSNSYQWLFNGNPLPGETAPMISLTNVDGSMAGNYSVIVSNGPYFSISQPATLTVSQSNAPIYFTGTSILSNSLAFNLVGESGRYYTIQSSTNLTNWQAGLTSPIGDPVFPFSFQQFYPATPVVQSTNASMPLLMPQMGSKLFFRALPYHASDENGAICINNLSQIYVAKALWQIETKNGPTAAPLGSDLAPYLPHQALPVCPLDATESPYTSYNFGNVATPPVCQIRSTNHFLLLVP